MIDHQIKSILERAAGLGLRLATDGEQLQVFTASSRSEPMPTEFVEELKRAKKLLIAYLDQSPCPVRRTVPPADLPLRVAPVRLPSDQRKLIIHNVGRQLKDPKLADWLCDRQERYYAATGKHWDCIDIVFTSAVDLVCWQHNLSPDQVCQTMASLDECANTSPFKSLHQ